MDPLVLLQQSGKVDAEHIAAFQEELARPDTTVDAALEKAEIDPLVLLEEQGAQYGVPVRSLKKQSVPFEVLNLIPEESAKHYRLAPIGLADGVLEVGILDPNDLSARDALTFISARIGKPYKVFLISEADFAKLLNQYSGLSGEVGSAITEFKVQRDEEQQEIAKKPNAPAPENFEEKVTSIDQGSAGDTPVTKIVATILKHAVEARASDIHIEPLADQTRVRFRIDGVLSTNITLPSKMHDAVVARVKVLANIRLDERRKPQDGRFSVRNGDEKIDCRVSTFPTYYGEKVVMRILGSAAQSLKLDALGLSERNLKMIRTAIKRPYGMVLISGPTGSGKTTTLYSVLNELDREKLNILSLEDPVEYTISGVSQSQVRPEIGYDFANGLRTTLRQDPNVIMVGEIRDSETANLAVQAALTGHLVLSTIHTNNAIGMIPRLLDMGVEPYLIPPVLVLGVAQRLVRRLPLGGGKKETLTPAMHTVIEQEFADLPPEYRKEVPSITDVYRLDPTTEYPTGTQGRMGCYEMFNMSAELEEAILRRASEQEMTDIVRKQGMVTIKEDAIMKSAKGLVPFEEADRLGNVFDTAEDESPENKETKIVLPPPVAIGGDVAPDVVPVSSVQEVTI